MTMNHEAVSARLDEYALGTLPAAERAAVETHVRECVECAQDLADLQLVLEGLGRAAAAVPAPDGLKARVLERLAREPQEPAIVPFRPAPEIRASRRRRRGWNGVWLAAAAALVVIAGVAVYIANTRQQRLEAELARAAGDITTLQEQLFENASQAEMVLSILTAADVRRVELAGEGGAQGSVARAFWSPTRGLLVAADSLPTPPPGRVFQVWLIGGSGPVSAGILGSRTPGRGLLIAPPPGGIATGPVTVAITDEPPGGLPSPTGGRHFVGSSL
jgi:anti-sigma-K factor RskA